MSLHRRQAANEDCITALQSEQRSDNSAIQISNAARDDCCTSRHWLRSIAVRALRISKLTLVGLE